MSDDGFRTINAENLEQAVGKYIIMYQGEKIVSKLEDVDKDKEVITFLQVTGEEKGQRFKAHYDTNAVEITVYDDEEYVYALLED